MLQERMSLLKNHFCHDIKYHEAFSTKKKIKKSIMKDTCLLPLKG